MSATPDTVVTVDRARVHDGPFMRRERAPYAVLVPRTGWLAMSQADAEHHASQGRTVGRVVNDMWWGNDGS